MKTSAPTKTVVSMETTPTRFYTALNSFVQAVSSVANSYPQTQKVVMEEAAKTMQAALAAISSTLASYSATPAESVSETVPVDSTLSDLQQMVGELHSPEIVETTPSLPPEESVQTNRSQSRRQPPWVSPRLGRAVEKLRCVLCSELR